MAEVGKMTVNSDPYSARAALGVFVASFCVYAITASPAIGWLDSPEFVAQAATLGVAHSPGHPLPALLGHLAGLVPIGDLVWRVNLMSALCAAGATALLFACTRIMLAAVEPRLGTASGRLLAVSLALIAGASWALWSNAVRAEVYALQSLLGIGAVYAVLRYEGCRHARWLLVGAFCLALGLANHHLLALTILVPALLVILIRRERLRTATYLQTVAMGVLGLCALLYLPIRSLAHPEVNFGAPHTLGRLFWTLRGAAFSKSATVAHASSPVVDALQVVLALNEALSTPLFLFAFYGAWTAMRQANTRRIAALLVGIVVLCCAARVVLGFDPETPDHHAYLLPAIFALFLLTAAGLARLISRALWARHPLRRAPALATVAIALLVPIQVTANWSAASQRDAWASDDMAHWELQSLPPRSLLLLAYFQSSFRIWALHSVEGMRPDVAVLDRSFLSYPGMREEAVRRYPELAELIEAPLRAGAPSPLALLDRIATTRPLRVQLHPNVDAPLARRLRPAGPWASFDGTEADDRRWRDALAEIASRAAPAEASEARGALLWHDATRLDQLCIIGEKAWAQQVLRDARRLAPHDQMLAEMAERCGLAPSP